MFVGHVCYGKQGYIQEEHKCDCTVIHLFINWLIEISSFVQGVFPHLNCVLFFQPLLGSYRNTILSKNEGRNTNPRRDEEIRRINRKWVAKAGTIRK